MRTAGLLPHSQERSTSKNAERDAAFQKAKAKFSRPSQTKKEIPCNAPNNDTVISNELNN
jgi:hypothetical protein